MTCLSNARDHQGIVRYYKDPEWLPSSSDGLKIYPNPDSIAWGTWTLFWDFERARWMGGNGRMAVKTVLSWDKAADRVLASTMPDHPTE